MHAWSQSEAMSRISIEQRLLPWLVLLLLSLLVLVVALWSWDRARTPQLMASAASGEAQQFRWKMVTTWPKNFPGLGTAPETFARMVGEMSAGRLQIRVYGAGEVVPAFGVFDAVSQGVAEVGHGASYYWKGKVPASVVFTTIPFGMTAQEMNSWLHYGGGLELWREAYAPAGLIPLAGGNTGVQMAGWFNREIRTVGDLRGLQMRIPGFGGDVLTALGGTSVTIPGGELYTSLQTRVIDALEWVGPYNDLAFGFQEVARYYYYPGWQEPGSTLELIVNQRAYERLPADLQAIVTYAARAANQDMLDEFTARNNAALRELVDKHKVQLRQIPDEVIIALHNETDRILDDMQRADPLTAKILASYREFLENARAYHRISEQAYLNARDLKPLSEGKLRDAPPTYSR
jgi:TRAP-type mannitol/chloroaromatic compound transport system substrate-binding protein